MKALNLKDLHDYHTFLSSFPGIDQYVIFMDNNNTHTGFFVKETLPTDKNNNDNDAPHRK